MSLGPEIHNGWRQATLGELLKFSNGRTSPVRADGFPYPVYGSNGIIGYSNDVNAKPETIIIGRVGTYCGSLRYSDISCWVTDNAICAIATAGNDAPFLFFLLETLRLNEWRTGSGQPLLNQSILASIPVNIPGLPEQQAIAHVLGTLDDKIELNRRMNLTLEEMAQAIFQDWFVDFGPVRAKLEGRKPYLPTELWEQFPNNLVDSELGEIPEGWEVKTLGELCDKPQYGYTASAKNNAVGPKFLRITDINKLDWVEWNTVPYCEISAEDFDKYRLDEGDIVIARMADPGHGCMIEGDEAAVFASYLIRFRSKDKVYQRLLQYWLGSEQYWDLVRGRGAGTTRTSLNAKVLGEFPLIVPANSLVEAFGQIIAAIRNRIMANVKEAYWLSSQRNTLLPKLVSGELRVP